MPPRVNQALPSGSFHPSGDAATYRDLILFEERLKANASSLNRRKRRYQLLLAQLLFTIAFLLAEVFVKVGFLVAPCQWALRLVFSKRYSPDAAADFHHYLTLGLLCVAVTTLLLFFVSGIYSEKIAYANQYVPHANRALRNFNMYLNVRQPPLQSKLPFHPFSFLFPRTSISPPPPTSPPHSRRRSPSPPASRMSKRSSSVPISPIPPSQNPRGELIFSSRVDKYFRDSYDRYRSAWERKRDERDRAAYQATWIGWLHMKLSRTPAVKPGTNPLASGASTPISAVSRAGSVRGRRDGSVGGTPSSSRRSSPVPARASRLTRTGTPSSPLSD